MVCAPSRPTRRRAAAGLSAAVADLRARIKAADALLIVTPEYNYSVPGVLKNAIDWASRPPEQPFDGKPIAIMGASPGALGTARAQYHLRQMFVFLNGMVLNRPEVMIGNAAQRFDAEGRLTDEKTREFVRALLLAEGLDGAPAPTSGRWERVRGSTRRAAPPRCRSEEQCPLCCRGRRG